MRKSLNRDERIANFVRHAGGEIGPESGAIDQILFLPQVLFRGQIVNDGDGAERVRVDRPRRRVSTESERRVFWIDPLLRRQRFVLASSVSRKNAAELAARRLRPV